MTGGRAGLLAVLSTERSGSTLLSRVLGGSPSVLAPPELHGFRYPDFDTWHDAYPMAMASLAWTLRALGVEADEPAVARHYAGASTEAVYQDLLERAGPGRLLLDKTPAYARQRETLERIETFAPLYLRLVRHPLGVALSMRQMRETAAETLPPGSPPPGPDSLLQRWRQRRRDRRRLARDLAYWRQCHETLDRFLAGIPAARQLTLTYEELVAQPCRSVPLVAGFLGVAVEDAMFRPGERLPDALGRGVGDWKIRARPAIDGASADRWREVLDERDLDPATAALWERLRGPAQR